MRLLTLPLTLASIPFRIAGAALSAAGGLLKDDDEEPAAVAVQPQPRFFRPRPPAPRTRATGNGGTSPAAGAGPEVHVDEPWPGYRAMNAADIKARLRSAPPTVAAAVSLYEAEGKGRTSVLEAAARRTRA
jgi:hypothetical protein